MKQVFSFLFAFALTIGLVQAQDPFNGKIVYGFDLEGEGAEQMAAMMPETMSMTMLKGDMIMEMQGGMAAMMMGKMLFLGNKGKAYMIKDSEETIYEMKREDDGEEEEADEPEIVDTGETMEIAGFTCTKYEVISGEAKSVAWVTDKIKPAKGKKAGSGGPSVMGMGANSSALPGFPLRMENQQGPMTIIIQAQSVDSTTPEKSLFKLPKGYDKEDFDPAMMGGGGGAGY